MCKCENKTEHARLSLSYGEMEVIKKLWLMYVYAERGWDTSIGIQKGGCLDGRVSIPGRCKGFSLLHGLQANSVAHPASIQLVLGAFSQG
jgi:hypothetical protein